MTAQNQNLWDSVSGLVIGQFASSQSLLSICRKMVEGFQSNDDSCQQICQQFNINTATGKWLDLIGTIRNLEREKGQDDTSFREQIKDNLFIENCGTSTYAIRMAKRFSGDPAPIINEELPGIFLIYTPNGRQMRRSDARRLAPAGVLGLPASALILGYRSDGPRFRREISLANGKKLIGVARNGLDDGITTGYLLDENNKRLVDENGNPLTYTFKRF